MIELFNQVYKNKKVFVTGHTGFKGSWLTLWLTMLGAEVVGYSLSPATEPALFNVLGLENKITHITGDIRDEESLKNALKAHKPEFVFHLAAQPLVRLSYKEPKLTYETNVMGTVNLFEAIRQTESVRAVVNVTSDKCYENREWVYGYRENEPMGGYDPYSSSKGISELVTSAYRNSFFNHKVALASARAGNVIGGGDWAEDRLIPDCIRSLSKNEDLSIRNPVATRPWQHVLEPLSGYLWLGAMLCHDPVKYSEGWNFGPNDDDVLTVEEIVKKALVVWGKGNYEVLPPSGVHEAKLLKLDISKAKYYLNWKPVYTASDAVIKTVEWYKNYYLANIDMRKYTEDQVREYSDCAAKVGIQWSNGLKGLVC